MTGQADEEPRIAADSDTLDEIYCQLLDGLMAEGAHHKQHHLEAALRLLVGSDVDTLKRMMQWQSGEESQKRKEVLLARAHNGYQPTPSTVLPIIPPKHP